MTNPTTKSVEELMTSDELRNKYALGFVATKTFNALIAETQANAFRAAAKIISETTGNYNQEINAILARANELEKQSQ